MGEGPLRFCPFCRECFEDEILCPDHELPLVTFDRLPFRRARVAQDDERVAFFDLRCGRGVLWLAAASTFVGFWLPLVTTTAEHPTTYSAMEVAVQVAPYLWALPLVGAAWVSVLARRRTPRSMRGARVAVPLLALLAATATYVAISHIREGAAQRTLHAQRTVSVQLEVGVWVIGAAIVLAVVAGFILGVLPRREALPHGAALDGDARRAILVGDDDEDDDDA